jgi:hypothetical protein
VPELVERDGRDQHEHVEQDRPYFLWC